MYCADNQVYLLLYEEFVLSLNKETLQQFNRYNYEKFKYYLGDSDGLFNKHDACIWAIES